MNKGGRKRLGISCSIEGCANPYYGRGFCKNHHQWHWNHGLLEPLKQPTLRERLLEGYMPIPESGCWIWMERLSSTGYGRVSIGNQKSAFAHRKSYEEFKGPIPEGMSVCHKCDIPSCINPDHLFLGTHQENMADSARKGRAKQPKNPIGAKHPRAKLTAEQVKEIREYKGTLKYLAEKYGVNPMTIYRARNGIHYGSVE